MPAYQSNAYMYSDAEINKLAHSLVAKTPKQVQRIIKNLEQLQEFPIVSRLLLDGRIHIRKLKSKNEKFWKTCKIVEDKEQAKNKVI